MGQQGWVISKTGDADLGEWEKGTPDPAVPFIAESFLSQFYNTHTDDIPRLILVPEIPTQCEEISAQLDALRHAHVEIPTCSWNDASYENR